MVEYS